jgi:hypothetical protein
MFRSAHWYDTRLPILKLFREHKFRGLDYIWQLLLANATDESEQKGYHFRLRYSLFNEGYEKLDHLVPDSDEALQQLAGIAASEGRTDTALSLLGQVKSSNFAALAYKGLAVVPMSEMAIAQRPLAPAQEFVIDLQKLKGFAVASTDATAGPPLSYAEAPDRLFVQAVPGATTVATLAAALPAGSIKLSIMVKLPEDVATPVEIMAAVLEPGLEVTEAMLAAPGTDMLASSGWLPLRAPYESRVVKLDLADPIKAPGTLVLGLRCAAASDRPRKTMVQFSSIGYLAFIGLGQPRHPRTGAPPTHQGARVLTDKDMRAARLTTAYKGERPLLEFPANEKGFILRPSKAGVVVARLEWAFPAFARAVIASVEIAHENASAFEFAMALVRPSDVDEWRDEGPKNSVAFSGWHKVERKFELHELKVELREAVRYSLSICTAIRLPQGANPIPSQSFWRKLVLVWDD